MRRVIDDLSDDVLSRAAAAYVAGEAWAARVAAGLTPAQRARVQREGGAWLLRDQPWAPDLGPRPSDELLLEQLARLCAE